MKTKITAISDLHGYLPKDLPEGDILCICGDIFPLDIQNKSDKCLDWIEEKFIPWTDELPYKEVILVAGNHDFFFEIMEAAESFLMFDNSKINYLQDSYVVIDGIKFYGTPWCHRFGRWAFMDSDENLEKIFKRIPENIDFLLTHDAPCGVSDICMQNHYYLAQGHIGSIPLRKAVVEKKPKYMLHGHLHSTNHECEMLEDTKVYNVSLLDENYCPTYKPLIIEYERNKNSAE